jgi:hypothetical protein
MKAQTIINLLSHPKCGSMFGKEASAEILPAVTRRRKRRENLQLSPAGTSTILSLAISSLQISSRHYATCAATCTLAFDWHSAL